MLTRVRQRWIALVAAIIIAAAGLSACQENSAPNSGSVGMSRSFSKDGTLAFLRANGDTIQTIDIEIADTPESQDQGLMYRRSLGMDQGMLFIFPTASTRGFWMKNTFIPLDIIFVGPDSQIVSIARRTQIMSEETIQPEGSRQFVVEVPAGFSAKFGLDSTTRIRWTREDERSSSFLDRLF